MQKYYSNSNLDLKEQLIGINICQKKTIEKYNPYLDYLFDPNFQRVNKPIVESFEGYVHRTRYAKYFLPKEERKYYNAVIGGWKLFDQSIKKDQITRDSIRNITTDQGDDHITSFC